MAGRGFALLLAAALAGCGGGGGDPAPATPTVTTFSGTAATGAALAGAAVSIKCATGTGSATTGSDGRYSLQVSGAVAPCVLQAVLGATRLHSLVEGGSATSVTANVTPLSELVVAQVAAADPAAFFAAFDAGAQARLTSTAVAQALATVSAGLQGVVDLNGIDPIRNALVATNGSTPGNALDQRLDALTAALATARTTLAEVSSAAANAAPIGNLVQRAAASCAGLRSGRYRFFSPSGTASTAVQVYTANAATLNITPANSTTAQQMTRTADCDYALPGGRQLLVSRSGVGVLRFPGIGGTDTALLLPEQTLALADLAGTWNALRFTRASSTVPYGADQSVFTLDAAGRFSNGANCLDLAACVPWPVAQGDLTAAADGGFTYLVGGVTVKVYGYKAADGRVVLFGVLPNVTGFFVASKQTVQTLPAVGDITSMWDYTVNSSGYATAIALVTTTVNAVNTAAPGSFTRVRASDGRVDGFTLNTPRTGLRYRAAGTSATNSGPVSISGIVVMSLGSSIGVTPYISVGQPSPFFGVSILQP